MPYESVDALQRALTRDVFHYAKDSKKAAGRALGTLVEIITFYLLKAWGFEKHIVIERRLPEYANPDITHNVEFSVHPSETLATIRIPKASIPITSRKIARAIGHQPWMANIKPVQLLSSVGLIKNACVLFEDGAYIIVAYLGGESKAKYSVLVQKLLSHPFAVFECKRVGVEEGLTRGPQTIEKAKQGAYVARTISSLQKIRMADGSMGGFLELPNGQLRCEPYEQMLKSLINSMDGDLLRNFTLSVGVVSNHGNWFTSDDHNKELKVLAQSYDWLLFLTDRGLSAFVDSLLLNPTSAYAPIRDAFVRSYTGQRGCNCFTKTKIAAIADFALQQYFAANLQVIESWFNVIAPSVRPMAELKQEIHMLSTKDWKGILS